MSSPENCGVSILQLILARAIFRKQFCQNRSPGHLVASYECGGIAFPPQNPRAGNHLKSHRAPPRRKSLERKFSWTPYSTFTSCRASHHFSATCSDLCKPVENQNFSVTRC